MLTEGERFPDIDLPDQTGARRSFETLTAANGLVLYVYPKDDTPGCTTEATDFRDLLGEFHKLGYEVVGLSKDGADSHCKFIAKYDLPFTLLSDEELSFMESIGAYGEKTMYGKVRMGVIRSTFIIDRGQTLRKAMRNVRAKGHAARVLRELEG
ncbi:MAG: peroxiredoxin [Acidobacteriota bacterium]